ncbi:hypothetical protein AAMO2058_000212800 [Amorphochlora amoebiformis]
MSENWRLLPSKPLKMPKSTTRETHGRVEILKQAEYREGRRMKNFLAMAEDILKNEESEKKKQEESKAVDLQFGGRLKLNKSTNVKGAGGKSGTLSDAPITIWNSTPSATYTGMTKKKGVNPFGKTTNFTQGDPTKSWHTE